MVSQDITNQTVLITGASSGIGLGLAKAFLERGANVVLNSRSEEKLSKAAQGLGHADQLASVVGYFKHKDTSQAMVELALKRFGRVDVLINNAGSFDAKPLNDYEEAELDGFLGNLRGTYLATQAAVGQMKNNGGGSVINITTVLAQRGAKAIPSSAPIASKGGIDSLTTNLAIELADDNIRVNAVAPGIIRTPLHGLSDEQMDTMGALHPLGRIGEIKDIVDAVLYLVDATFVTGVILPVDGGVMAGV
ncbi:MAG: SDR family oxidoreductase [Planctomycetota bacterium]|nr:SDR family oxidoreductase [Planctomycetota bacterium]